jgi:hypothetical protein
MKLKDILAVAGKPGLYKFISQGRNGIIVEGISDTKRMLVHSSSKVSALADIAIYTETEEVPLKEIFGKIYEKENGKQAINHKEPDNKLKDYFSEILPDYDKNRVYGSDIKKLISWYNLLIGFNLLDPNENDDEEEISKESVESPKIGDEKTAKQINATSMNKTALKGNKKAAGKASTQTKTSSAKSKSAGTSKKPSA